MTRQAIHEGSESRPFILNLILPMLAMSVARGAIRDYSTIEELLEIPPPEKEIYRLYWKPCMLDKPFYENQTGEIKKANSFSSRLNGLGRCTGYPNPPTIHDFRAEGLHLIGKLVEPPTS
jgi:hypothetical protein